MRHIKMFSGLFILFFLLSSFGGDSKVYTNTKVWLPEDFDSRNTILLVQNFSMGMKGNDRLKKAEDNVTEKMKAVMQQSYPYKYEFASSDQISNSPKYANTDLYRYVIIDINGSTPTHMGNSNPPNMRPGSSSNPNSPSYHGGAPSTGGMEFGSSVNDLYIYDRKLDKSYPPTGHAQGYVTSILKPMMNTIVQYLKGLTSPPAPVPSGTQH
jgi:hypothetical protein